jgi:hypothetical protein
LSSLALSCDMCAAYRILLPFDFANQRIDYRATTTQSGRKGAADTSLRPTDPQKTFTVRAEFVSNSQDSLFSAPPQGGVWFGSRRYPHARLFVGTLLWRRRRRELNHRPILKEAQKKTPRACNEPRILYAYSKLTRSPSAHMYLGAFSILPSSPR